MAGVPIDTSFDVEFANEIAHLESYNKHLYRPNTYLHKWWARRCGSTFRLILKHLVDDPIPQDYYAPGGLEGKVILDPMMGGGTTLHEGIRLGASVIGADVDPIPILQARATLSEIPLRALESAFESLYDALHSRLAPFFSSSCPCCNKPSPVMHVLYGQKQTCTCGVAVFVDSTTLRYEANGSEVKLCGTCGEVFTDDGGGQSAEHACQGEGLPYPVREKGTKACPACGDPFQELTATPYYERYAPVAVVGQCEDHGLYFKRPDAADLAVIKRADDERDVSSFEPLEEFDVSPGPKSVDLVRHGIPSYLDLFSSRQLTYLSVAVEALAKLDGLARLNLGLLISTSVEFNSMLCGYKGGSKGRPGAIRHTFSHHAYSFPYTALENNPVYPAKASGTLQALFHSRLRKARKWASLPTERRIDNGKARKVAIRGEIDAGIEAQDHGMLCVGTRKFMLAQGSSIKLDLPSDSVDHVVTDPPYFDNVQYSDLSAFFRVWLKRLFSSEARWDYDLSESAVDPQANGNGQYEQALTGIFTECHRVLRKQGGRLIFTFHHWNPKGWAAITAALRAAGFVLLNRYVIHAENPASVHIVNLRSLRHDAVLVLASSATETGPDWPKPDHVDTSSSEAFVKGCADALGFMLSSELDTPGIHRTWTELLP